MAQVLSVVYSLSLSLTHIPTNKCPYVQFTNAEIDTVAHLSRLPGQKQLIVALTTIIIAVSLCCHKGGRQVEPPPSTA